MSEKVRRGGGVRNTNWTCYTDILQALLGEEFYLMFDWDGILVTCFIYPLKMLSPAEEWSQASSEINYGALFSRSSIVKFKLGGRWRFMKFNSGQSCNNLLPQWFNNWSGTADVWSLALHLSVIKPSGSVQQGAFTRSNISILPTFV